MPKTNAETAQKLARLSSDCSFLLTHLVRQNDGKSALNEKSDMEAKDILCSILGLSTPKTKPCLKASFAGWYGSMNDVHMFDPSTGNFASHIKPKAVCFTESTLAGLKAHRDIFRSKYGVAFDRNWLFKRGANPCLNIRSDVFKKEIQCRGEQYLRKVYNLIPTQLHPFMNIITEGFDATHEREWRYPGDLRFDYKDVLFVFCPEKDFPMFCSVQSSGRPVLFDLAWLDRI